MDKISIFFRNYTKAVTASAATRQKTLSIIEALTESDPAGLTKYEVSFKVQGNRFLPITSFTNIDANAYAAKSSSLFLSRLRVYERIVAADIKSCLCQDLIAALEEIARTPMDLYFGAEIEKGEPTFVFWLIFGGAGRDGKVAYCPYNNSKIIRTLLRNMKYRVPAALKEKVFHMSIRVNKQGLSYQLFYEGNSERSLSGKMKELNRRLSDHEHYFCFSEDYIKSGSCVEKSAFVYLPHGPFTQERGLKGFLEQLNGLGAAGAELSGLRAGLKLTRGQLTLLRWDGNDALTLYLSALK